MNVTVQIPDDLARRLTEAGGDLSRRALEAFALEEFKSGHVTKPELGQLLGYETRAELDGFLKAHAVFEEYTLDDLEHKRAAARQFEKESGLWVLRTGQPIDPNAIDRTLTALRDERDLTNLGPIP
jgi:Uncharacterised protein family (UPF0175)